MKTLIFLTNKWLTFLLLFSTFVFFESCQKDVVVTPENLKDGETFGQTVIEVKSNELETRDPTSLTMGRTYGSVFNVTNVKNAYNALTGKTIGTPMPTHQYIKLKPADYDELDLVNSSDLFLYPYPLDREITGGVPQSLQPALENGMPVLYTCRPMSVSLPAGVAYDLLDNLYLTDYDNIVTEKAFELAGEDSMYTYNRALTPNLTKDNAPASLDLAKGAETWDKGIIVDPGPGPDGPGRSIPMMTFTILKV